MLLVAFSHYSLGRFLGARGFFTSSLFGICASGLVVAILANVNAGAISQYVTISVAILAVWTLKSIAQNIPTGKLSFNWLYSATLVVGFLIMNPVEKTIFRTIGDENFVFFNPHNSYLGGQSSEMIAADYSSRLRISNQFPLEYSSYHFFQSAVLAILRNFGSENLTLVGFLTSQVVITAIALGSFFEMFSRFSKKNLISCAFFCFWIYLGFSFFRGSVNWQVVSNNSITFWIFIFLVWAIADRNKNFIYLSLIVLMVSSIRFYPTAVILLVYIFILKNNFEIIRSIKNEWKIVSFFVLANLYTLLTISFPKPRFAQVISEQVLSSGWHHNLFFYGLFERLAKNLNLDELPKYNEGLAYTGLYERFPSGTFQDILLSIFVILIFSALIFRSLFQWIHNVHKVKLANAIAILVLIFTIALLMGVSTRYSEIWAASAIKFAFLIVMPYMILNNFLLKRLSLLKGNIYYKPFLVFWITLVFIQFTGANELKGPLAYATFDMTTWALIGLLVSNFLDLKVKKLIPLTLVCTMAVLVFPPKFDRIFIWPSSSFVSITTDEFVLKNVAYCVELKAIQCDALGAVFGKRIYLNPKSPEFITFEFAIK